MTPKRNLVKELEKQEEYITRVGVGKIEFSYLLDMFRDERELISAALGELKTTKDELRKAKEECAQDRDTIRIYRNKLHEVMRDQQ